MKKEKLRQTNLPRKVDTSGVARATRAGEDAGGNSIHTHEPLVAPGREASLETKMDMGRTNYSAAAATPKGRTARRENHNYNTYLRMNTSPAGRSGHTPLCSDTGEDTEGGRRR